MNSSTYRGFELDVGSAIKAIGWRKCESSPSGFEVLLFTKTGIVPAHDLDAVPWHGSASLGEPVRATLPPEFSVRAPSGVQTDPWDEVTCAASDGIDIYFATVDTIWRIDSGNSIHLVAGRQQVLRADQRQQEDGNGRAATFNYIRSMARGSGSLLYVLDLGRLRVVQVATSTARPVAAKVMTVEAPEEKLSSIACNSHLGSLFIATHEAVYQTPEPLALDSPISLTRIAGTAPGEPPGIPAAERGAAIDLAVHAVALTETGRLLIVISYWVDMGDYKFTLYTSSSRRGLQRMDGVARAIDHSHIVTLPRGGIATFSPGDPYLRLLSDAAATPLCRAGTCVPSVLRSSSLAADLEAVRHNPNVPPDVTVLAGGRAFPAHRLVLAARCEYFARRLADGFADSGASELDLPGADPAAFEQLLSYMYGGELRPSAACLRPLAELADRLVLGEASAHLQRQLVAAASPGSVVGDMLWAEARGLAEVLAGLKALYIRCADLVAEQAPESIELLIRTHPRLHMELHTAMVQRAKPW